MQMRLNPNQIVTYQRPRKSEIDMLKNDLTKRGFKLIDEGSYKKTLYTTSYWAKFKAAR